jgi:hypothetical protein
MLPMVDAVLAYQNLAIVGSIGWTFLEFSAVKYPHDLPWVPRPWGGPWQASSKKARQFLIAEGEDPDDLDDDEVLDEAEELWFEEHEDEFQLDQKTRPAIYMDTPVPAQELTRYESVLPREFLVLHQFVGCLSESPPGLSGGFVPLSRLERYKKGRLTGTVVFEALNGDLLVMARDGGTFWIRASGGPAVPASASVAELFSRYGRSLVGTTPFDSYATVDEAT